MVEIFYSLELILKLLLSDVLGKTHQTQMRNFDTHEPMKRARVSLTCSFVMKINVGGESPDQTLVDPIPPAGYTALR